MDSENDVVLKLSPELKLFVLKGFEMSEIQENDKVVIKSTRMGLMISMSAEGDFKENLLSLTKKMQASPNFFNKAQISMDLGWREITEEELMFLLGFLKEKEISLQGIISSSLATRKLAESEGIKVIIGRLGLADHYSRKTKKEPVSSPVKEQETSVKKSQVSNEETVMIKRTVRSGQKICHAGNVVIQGDLNPGAEVEATGDVIVLGALRGVAHAGSNGDETSVVMALTFAPTQVRIAGHVAITNKMKSFNKNTTVFARVADGKMILCPYMG